MVYSGIKLYNDGLGPDIEAINHEKMFSTIGFAIYTFEGIGIMMPIMQACDCPERFDKIYFNSIMIITVMFLAYGSIMYLAYGNMKEQIVF